MRNNALKNSCSRRSILKTLAAGSIAAGAGAAIPGLAGLRGEGTRSEKMIRIKNVESNFEREPLLRPFGFKGDYMSEIWQSAALIESESGLREVGLCSQSVLWSDASVFARYSESAGNSIMYLMQEYALRKIAGESFTEPVGLLEEILDDVYQYGVKVSQNANLRKTFALNSLVAVDNALWILYAKENDFKTFDEMLPEPFRPGLSFHHKTVASIPLMAYTIPISEIKQAVDDGYFFLKVKIGQPGTQAEMLEKDKKRIEEIHRAIGGHETPYTKDGRIPYYFDANGRYEEKETLLKLLDHAGKIGARDRIAVIEEPFPEEKDIFVGDLGVRIAADESAHTDKDAVKRIEMGYSAIAVKAIAKTLSMTLRIIKAAHEKNVPCFCADLTVTPILIDWNKNVAARLAPFPGLGLGLLETNGHQNYSRWETLLSYHPFNGAPWTKTVDGVFNLTDDFYEKSGGIFTPSKHYMGLFPGAM